MMKNKVGLKKLILAELIMGMLFFMVFAGVLYKQYQAYTVVFNEKAAAMLGEIASEYPQVEKAALMEILNREDGREDGARLLRKYGIDLKEDAVILENDKVLREAALLDGGLLLLFFAAVFGLFLKYNNGKDRKINEIIAYLEEINRGNYKLDISDNSEETLSILKNELYKTTVKLREAAENSIEDKVQLKDSLSDISHQLKTPLTSIMIMVDAILDDEGMEEATRNAFLRDIKREVTGTRFLVEALLKLSRLDSNTMKFMRQEVDVAQLLSEAVKHVEILGELRNVTVRVWGSAEKKLVCDLKWQVEALTNIIKNCMEHSKEQGEIHIHYTENAIYTEIKIKDFGDGIEAEDLPHIFERFYKGKHSSGDSVGIGLALAKAIIEKDHGYIQADSEVGAGTEFKVRYFR